MPDLGIVGLDFEKGIFIFEIHTLEFPESKVSCKNEIRYNLGPKMPYLSVLGSSFEKLLS